RPLPYTTLFRSCSPIAPRGEGREPAVRAFAAASAVGGGGVARGSAVATATVAGGTALTGLTAPSGRARASPTLAAPAAGTTPPTPAAPAAGATFAVGGIGLARPMRRRAPPGSRLRQHRAGGDPGGGVLGAGAGLPCTGGAPGAVQVGLVLDRRIGMDHQRDLVDVDATGGDVGAHQGRVAPGAEGLEVAGAGTLREVAVQVHGRHAAGGELAGQ